jgi:hypothetical protein
MQPSAGQPLYKPVAPPGLSAPIEGVPMPISTSDMNYIITLFAVMIVSFTVIVLFGIARTPYWRKEESKCPYSGKYWAKQDVGKELVDSHWKRFSLLTFMAWGRFLNRVGRIYKHKKYRLYYRCKYCMHEWTSIFETLEIWER